MKSAIATLLSCAAVVAFGLGISVSEPAAKQAAPSILEPSNSLLEHAAPRTENLRVMPTVYVTATVARNDRDDTAKPAKLLGSAVTTARSAIGGGGSAVRAARIGIAVPYFAFAQASANGTE